MSQYDYEHQEQFDNSRHWQDEQPSASEAVDNSRFVDRLQEGQPANIVRIHVFIYESGYKVLPELFIKLVKVS